jgi:Lipase (class 3)
MAFAVGYSLDEVRLLLLLAASAYVDEKPLPGESVQAQTERMGRDIDMALGQSAYSGWQVVWGPALAGDRGSMMYVAGNASLNQYAVAIRGTDWSFWLDWVEDFGSLLPLTPFPYLVQPAGDSIKVAAGTLLGLDDLAQMTGGTVDGAQDLATFLRGLPTGADVFVTGHSLGGCLASVVAAWAAWVCGSAARLKAYTFAAPSAGNGAFADYFNSLFWDSTTNTSTAFRLYNTLDSVPNAWASLATIATYYQPSPLCPTYVKDIVADAEHDVGSEYVQVGTVEGGSAVALPGTVVPWWSGWDLDPTGTAQFAHQVEAQHALATYHGLLASAPTLAATVKLAAMGARMSELPAQPGA